MHCVECYMRFVALHVPLILGVKVLHNSCNTVTRALPNMSTLSPQALQVYISGRALMPVLQLLNVPVC